MLDADKKDTSSLAQAVLEGNRCEIVRVFDIIEATGKCQFCDPSLLGSTWVNLSPLGSTWVNLGQLASTWVFFGLLQST